MGRRMADTAVHLVDRVFPRVPIRQWVLSLPKPIRYILARDAKLLTKVVGIFVREIFRDLRRRAGNFKAKESFPGAVTGIQRHGSFLNLNIHPHSLLLDGLYVRDPSTGNLSFRKAAAPSREDLERVLSRTRRRILRFLAKKGFVVARASEEQGGRTELEHAGDEPSVFDAIKAASVREWIALSEEPRTVEVLGRRTREPISFSEKAFCVNSGDGFNLQAGVRIKASDREGLERLCKYVLRPPFATERLERLPDGNISYEFKRPRPTAPRTRS